MQKETRRNSAAGSAKPNPPRKLTRAEMCIRDRNVIVPIAGLVITYVLCYELISMVTEKNNMHDVDNKF